MIDFNDIKSTILLFALNCYQSKINRTLCQLCKKLRKNSSNSRKKKKLNRRSFLVNHQPVVIKKWVFSNSFSSGFSKTLEHKERWRLGSSDIWLLYEKWSFRGAFLGQKTFHFNSRLSESVPTFKIPSEWIPIFGGKIKNY